MKITSTVFVKLEEGMMAESGSIDSVEYVMYNYSVSDLNYSFVRYIFPIHRSDRIGLTRMGDRIGSIRSEMQIGSDRSGSMH